MHQISLDINRNAVSRSWPWIKTLKMVWCVSDYTATCKAIQSPKGRFMIEYITQALICIYMTRWPGTWVGQCSISQWFQG